jgi:hypothetical protein
MDEAMLLDSRTFLTKPRLTLRSALPSEYLRRWAVLTDIFGLPTSYLGTTGNSADGPQMIVSQPYIEQADDDQPTLDDVSAFMQAHGFSKIAPESVAMPEVADVTWYRQSDGILITDAHARNFRKALNGTLVPVDLVVTLIQPGATKALPNPVSEWKPNDTEDS